MAEDGNAMIWILGGIGALGALGLAAGGAWWLFGRENKEAPPPEWVPPPTGHDPLDPDLNPDFGGGAADLGGGGSSADTGGGGDSGDDTGGASPGGGAAGGAAPGGGTGTLGFRFSRAFGAPSAHLLNQAGEQLG